MKKTISFTLILTLFTITMVSCKPSDFNYAETTVPTADAQPAPWQNGVEFSYTPSDDRLNNVINLNAGFSSMLQPVGDQLYLYGHYRAICYDPATARQTDLCKDPICTHTASSDCPLFGMDMEEFHIVGDKLLYYRDNTVDGETQMQLMLYSMTDRTTKVLRTVNRKVEYDVKLVPLENCCYFIDEIYDEETDDYSYAFCCQDYESGKIEVLRHEEDSNTVLQGSDGEVIYIYDVAENALIGLSLDGKTELSRAKVDPLDQNAICKDGYLISMDNNGELWRMNTDGSDRHSLGITAADCFYLTDSYIYYRKVEGKKTGIEDLGPYGTAETDVELQAIYRSDHEGKNETLVWKNTDENNILVTDHFNRFVVQGNYIYCEFTYCRFEGEKVTIDSGSGSLSADSSASYARIDCTTGEVYFIETELLPFEGVTW